MQILTSNIQHFKNKKEFFDYSSEYSSMRSFTWNNNYFLYEIQNVVLLYLEDINKFHNSTVNTQKKEKKFHLDDSMKDKFNNLNEYISSNIETKNLIKKELKIVSDLLNKGLNKEQNADIFKQTIFNNLEHIDQLLKQYEFGLYHKAKAESVDIEHNLQNYKQKSFLEYFFNKDVKDKQEVTQPTNKNRITPK